MDRDARRRKRFSMEIGIRAAVTAMFGNLKARWRQARGAQLKRQFENATRWADDLGDEQAKAALKKLECPIAIKDKRGNFVTDLCW